MCCSVCPVQHISLPTNWKCGLRRSLSKPGPPPPTSPNSDPEDRFSRDFIRTSQTITVKFNCLQSLATTWQMYELARKQQHQRHYWSVATSRFGVLLEKYETFSLTVYLYGTANNNMQRFALDLRLMMSLQQRMRKCLQDKKKCKYGDRTKLQVTDIGLRLGEGMAGANALEVSLSYST